MLEYSLKRQSAVFVLYSSALNKLALVLPKYRKRVDDGQEHELDGLSKLFTGVQYQQHLQDLLLLVKEYDDLSPVSRKQLLNDLDAFINRWMSLPDSLLVLQCLKIFFQKGFEP